MFAKTMLSFNVFFAFLFLTAFSVMVPARVEETEKAFSVLQPIVGNILGKTKLNYDVVEEIVKKNSPKIRSNSMIFRRILANYQTWLTDVKGVIVKSYKSESTQSEREIEAEILKKLGRGAGDWFQIDWKWYLPLRETRFAAIHDKARAALTELHNVGYLHGSVSSMWHFCIIPAVENNNKASALLNGKFSVIISDFQHSQRLQGDLNTSNLLKAQEMEEFERRFAIEAAIYKTNNHAWNWARKKSRNTVVGKSFSKDQPARPKEADHSTEQLERSRQKCGWLRRTWFQCRSALCVGTSNLGNSIYLN